MVNTRVLAQELLYITLFAQCPPVMLWFVETVRPKFARVILGIDSTLQPRNFRFIVHCPFLRVDNRQSGGTVIVIGNFKLLFH